MTSPLHRPMHFLSPVRAHFEGILTGLRVDLDPVMNV